METEVGQISLQMLCTHIVNMTKNCKTFVVLTLSDQGGIDLRQYFRGNERQLSAMCKPERLEAGDEACFAATFWHQVRLACPSVCYLI